MAGTFLGLWLRLLWVLFNICRIPTPLLGPISIYTQLAPFIPHNRLKTELI